MVNDIAKKINVVHLLPHVGGGVGTVIRSIISESKECGGFTHLIITLENVNDKTLKWCHKNDIQFLQNAWNNLEKIEEIISATDILHVHWWNHPQLNYLLASKKLPPSRVILWSHVNGHHVPQYFFDPLVEFPHLFVAATPFSLSSPTIKNCTEEFHKNHIIVIQSSGGIPHGTPQDLPQRDEFRVGYVGTVDYSKMHQNFITIWGKCEVSSPLIVCGGPSWKQLQGKIDRDGLGKQFDIRGEVANVESILKEITVLAYPLNKTHYGTGEQVLIEAMSFGVVPVVFDNGCEQFIVEDKVTGIVAKDENEFIDAILFLQNNPDRCRKMAKAGMELTQHKFTKKNAVKQWHTLYHEAMELPEKECQMILHKINGYNRNSPISLLLNSYGNSHKGILLQEFLNNGAKLKKDDFPRAVISETRGSPFHYRDKLPFDNSVVQICEALLKSKLKRICPICKSGEYELITPLNYALFDDLNFSGESKLCSCLKCGMVFNDTPLSAADFDYYYSKNDHYLCASRGGSGGTTDSDIERYNRIYREISPHLSTDNPSTLDFGCGKGGMLQWLTEKGITSVAGIESSKSCRESIRKNNTDIRVFESLNELKSEKFDIIILSHLLEHFHSPLELLQQLKPFTHRKTVLYIEVPDSEYYLSNEPKWQELYFEHINHFTIESLTTASTMVGISFHCSGKTPFQSNSPKSAICIYAVAYFEDKDLNNELFIEKKIYTIKPYRNNTIDGIIEKGKGVSIWGISQYTQFVLGNYPFLIKNVAYLFDSSEAKIGRKIDGITILATTKLTRLNRKDTLLIPESTYLDEMHTYLKEICFQGNIIHF